MPRTKVQNTSATLHKRVTLRGSSAALALCLPVLAPFGAQAQETVRLDEVVVTAGGFEQLLKDAPASVSVISAEDLEKGKFSSLTDALKEVQGLVVTGIATERDIQMRGLPGGYTLILIDGRRQNTREARPNGSAGYEQSFIPPITAIERIEVVRGPMSSLYGSDAMGGVINVITKKANQTWTGSVTLETTVQQHGELGNANQLSFNLSGPLVKDRLALQIWGRGYKRDEDRVLEGAQAEDSRNLTARLTYTPSLDHDLWLEAGRASVEGETTTGRSLPSTGTSSRRDYLREWVALGHTGRFGDVTTELSYQIEDGRRDSANWDTGRQSYVDVVRVPKIRNAVLDFKVTAPLQFHGSHTFVGGLQHQNTKLDDEGHISGVSQTLKVKQWAVFAEDEWRLNDSFAITGGLRFNKHEIYGSNVTPRLYAVWHASDNLTVKGGISTGFKAPELRQVAPGYYMPTQRGAGLIAPNSALQPEKSTNIELAALWDNQAGLSFGATAFHTKFRNKIASENTHKLINPDTGSIIDPLAGGVCDAAALGGYAGYKCLWQAFNIDSAVVRGIELNGAWQAHETVSLRGSYTYTDSRQKTGTHAGFPLARTPKHRASLRADWITPVDGLETWATATYHGSEINGGARIGSNGSPVTINGAAGRKYKAYGTLDIGGSYRVNDRTTFNAALYNVLDKRTDATEYNAVGEGRRLWLGLTTAF